MALNKIYGGEKNDVPIVVLFGAHHLDAVARELEAAAYFVKETTWHRVAEIY